METIIPFITAQLVNDIKAGTNMNELLKTGLILTIIACVSLLCGGLGFYLFKGFRRVCKKFEK